jgi:S1-C subfamily serine protease
VRGVLQAAVSGRKITRPWLGAGGQHVTAEIAQSLGLPRPEGVLVNEVVPESPAAAAGIRTGDVVLNVNGHAIDDPDGLRFRIAIAPLDLPARLTLWRAGQLRDVSVTLVLPPEQPPRDPARLAGRHPLSGAAVANLNPALAEELGIDSAQRGVIVTSLAEGGIAEQLGLEPGDVVVSLNKQPVESVAQLRRLLADTAPPWVVTVKRGDKLLSTPPMRG